MVRSPKGFKIFSVSPICRKSIFVSFLTSILFCISSFAQNEDSLLMVLDTATDRTVILTTLDGLGIRAQRKNPLNAIKYYEEYYRVAGDDIIKQAYAYNQIGAAWYYGEDLKQSTAYYFKALEVLSDVEDHATLARTYNNIGWNLQLQNDLNAAIEYFKKAEEHAAHVKNKLFLAGILNNLGVAYKNNGDYASALEMYEKAYESNLELESLSGQISNLNNMSVLNIHLKKYEQSAKYLRMLRPLFDQTMDTVEMMNYFQTNGKLFLALKSYKQALDSLQIGLEFAKITGHVTQRKDLELLRYEAYNSIGNFENALKSYKTYAQLNDSIYRTGQAEFIQELNANYNLTQKEKDLQIAQNKNLEQQLYLILISCGLGLAIIALIFILRNYQLKQKKNKELNYLNTELKESYSTIKEKNEEIQVQSEELKEAYEEIRAINENLECTIAERTQKLKLHNEKLVKYARMNAHDVRGPLARILGLVQLFSLAKPEEYPDYISRVKHSAEELDCIIYEMNKILEEEDFG